MSELIVGINSWYIVSSVMERKPLCLEYIFWYSWLSQDPNRAALQKSVLEESIFNSKLAA
jgi:hypothetical protein